MTDTKTILCLPAEVVEHIFSYLRPSDILSVRKTCKLFHQLSHSDQLWSEVCNNQYLINIPASPQGFAQNFYKNILHKFGKHLGLWQAHADCYGGLLQIKYSDRKLLGVELRLPKVPHLTEALRHKTLFSMGLDEENYKAVSMNCCINPRNTHGFTLDYGFKSRTSSDPPSWYLTRRCAEGVCSSDHDELQDTAVELANWLDDQMDTSDHQAIFTTRDQFIFKYIVLRQMDLKTHYSRLTLPPRSLHTVPIQPGLFKGTYSAHGLELILLTYEDGNRVKAVKITGDPNVPAGQITFRADLPFCMYLGREVQNSLEELERIEPASSEIHWSELPTSQPFSIPQDCHERYSTVPDHCRARFHGFGQIASSGFRSPQFTEGHWVVFDENLFGFLWIRLSALSVYHRVQEDLAQVQ